MYARQPKGWMLSVLKGLAEMPSRDGTFLHWGHTVPNGQPMTDEPSELTSFFFLPPVCEAQEFENLTLGEDRVDFLMLVPITRGRARFRRPPRLGSTRKDHRRQRLRLHRR